MSVRPNFSAFIKLFNELAGHKHRYEVFRDFVTLTAIALHNGFNRCETLEAEYLGIVKRYDPETVRNHFPQLLAHLVELLEPEPTDILGQLFMQLEISNERTGQFFTPPELSFFMAKLLLGDELNEAIKTRGFVTVSEPACGAGGMVLAFAKTVIEQKHNPAKVMWASCQDIDRTAALMCYIQLTLWNIPAEVIVGNTIAMERREVFYTPAHWMGFWNVKLRERHQTMEQGREAAPLATANAPARPIHVLDEAIVRSAPATVATPTNATTDTATLDDVRNPTDDPTEVAPAQTITPVRPSAQHVRSGSSAAPPQLGFDFDL